MLHLEGGRRFLWKLIDTLTWRTEGTGFNFTREDVLAMEMGEVFYYFRQARRHHEEIAEARKRGSGGSNGTTTETETDGWDTSGDDRDDADLDESISVESLMDE